MSTALNIADALIIAVFYVLLIADVTGLAPEGDKS